MALESRPADTPVKLLTSRGGQGPTGSAGTLGGLEKQHIPKPTNAPDPRRTMPRKRRQQQVPPAPPRADQQLSRAKQCPRAQQPSPTVWPSSLRVRATQPIAQWTSSCLAAREAPQPVAHSTHAHSSHQSLLARPSSSAKRRCLSSLMQLWHTSVPWGLHAMPVSDKETGKLQKHRQLRNHSQHKETWRASYTTELGWPCQGTGADM